MEIDKPIPSYASIDGRKVKIYHPGQRRTCARCQKTADHCPGKSNAKLCDESNGIKVNVEGVWKEILMGVGYKEWNGGEKVVNEESETGQNETGQNETEDTIDELSTKYPNCDGILISNVPEDTTLLEIENLINSALLNSADGASILQEENPRSRLVQNIALDKVMQIIKKVDNRTFKGKVIHCRPHVPSTPPKEPLNVANNNEENNKKDESKSNDVAIPTIEVRPAIPGLPDKDAKKALKAAQKQQKRAEKERKKKAEEEELKKKPKLTKQDFLTKTPKTKSVVDDFVFSDYSDDSDATSDVFEDSKEMQSEDEFLTPLNFTSLFGQRTAALSASTPNLSRSTSKREHQAPRNQNSQRDQEVRVSFQSENKKLNQ